MTHTDSRNKMTHARCILLVGSLCIGSMAVAVCQSPSPDPEPDPESLFDTPYPSAYNGNGATLIPALDSMGFHFPARARADQEQPLATYDSSQGFAAIVCDGNREAYNVSFAHLYTPEGPQDYAVHLSVLTPYPNNITGSSAGTDQKIFYIAADMWLNLRDGVISTLSTDSNLGVFTFDSQYDGQTAQEFTGRADAVVWNTVHYIPFDTFYGVSGSSNGTAALDYMHYPPPAMGSVNDIFSGTQEMDVTNWVRGAETLQLFTGFVAMQASAGAPCTADTAGAYELGPLLDYLTDILNDVISENGSTFFEQYFGQLNATYVQSNSALGPDIYVTLRTSGAFLPVDQLIRDPALSLTESECIRLAKNYTLSEANVNGLPPANVWNFCATGICNYTFVNGTSATSVSPYAGTHTASTCQLGYSSAVDNNEYVEPAYISPPGQGSAGRFNPALPTVLPQHMTHLTAGIVQTSGSSFAGSPYVASPA